MGHKPDNTPQELSRDLLRVYEHAVRQRDLDAAEHVLCALEAMARSDADCQAVLELAYLQMAKVGYVKA
jgi:hypothetical protein